MSSLAAMSSHFESPTHGIFLPRSNNSGYRLEKR